ncbi:MAG: hypothetical protein OXG60_07280 [Chloroflexi bacterium]|nr:hypothetical protein [Chloroflexota bacterium]
MAKNKDPHLVYRRKTKDWSVIKEGNKRDSHTGLTRQQGKTKTKEIADREGTNPNLHGKDGKFSKN